MAVALKILTPSEETIKYNNIIGNPEAIETSWEYEFKIKCPAK